MKERLNGLSPAEYHARHGAFSVEQMYEPPDWIKWDDAAYRGDAYAAEFRGNAFVGVVQKHDEAWHRFFL